jgi:Protein of unknown function (DUF4239)
VNALQVSLIVFACVFAGSIFGMFVRLALPEDHLSSESKEVVKLATGVVGTLTALVLGLLLASAQSSFNSKQTGLTKSAANVVLLDRVMAQYGTGTKDARELLRNSVATLLQTTAVSGVPQLNASVGSGLEAFQKMLRDLSPANDAQRSLQSRALQLSDDVAETRWLLSEQLSVSLPTPFLVVLTFWLAAIFFTFGLFAPPNGTVLVALFVCALSISGAILLILELDKPFGGLIRLSFAPMSDAYSRLGE